MPANKTNWRTGLAPAPLGNQRARKHGVYSKILSPLEDAELEQLADVVRDLCPIHGDTLEPAIQILAAQLWRLRRGYADLQEHSVTRGRKDRGRMAPAWDACDQLERSILRNLVELGMTSRSAAALGLELRRLEESDRDVDLDKLSEPQRRKLSELLSIATAGP